MLTRRSWILLGVGVALTGCGIFLGYSDITRLGLLLLLLLAITAFAMRRSVSALSVHRSVRPPSLACGQRATVTLRLVNESGRRTGVGRVHERVDPQLGESQGFVLPSIEPGDGQQLQYVVQGRARGAHHLGPMERTLEDPFGLTRRRVSDAARDRVLVLPRITPLGATQPPGSGLGSEGETPQMVALHGDEDVSIRAYHQGDDLRKVHWKTTAHRGELMVRQEDRPSRRSAVVLVDSRRDGHRGPAGADSFEWAVDAAASVVVRLEELSYSTHLATAETLLAGTLDTPGTVSAHLESLALAEPTDGETYRRVRTRAREAVHSGAIVVVFLTDLDDGVDEIAAMRQHGASALAFLLDTASFADPSAVPSPRAELHRAVLAGAGWRVVVVRADTTVLAAWQTVSRRSLVRVGAL